MKILLLDGAAETLELFDDIGLRAPNPVGAGRMGFVSDGAAAGLYGSRNCLNCGCY